MNLEQIVQELPGKNCGLCGFKTCQELAQIASRDPDALARCIPLAQSAAAPPQAGFEEADIAWKDSLGREYDFVLEKFPEEPGPRETIILFNPTKVEVLQIKKGDVLYGRPAWISCGCPVTHVGMVVEEPDYFNGTVVWCIVGPLLARQRGINIGYYNTTAYEGIVKHSRKELQIGRRYYFQPRYCMLQWRHCGLINSMARTEDGLRVRIEGLWIG